MQIPGNTLKRGYDHYREDYIQKAQEVLDSGWYVLGPEVEIGRASCRERV